MKVGVMKMGVMKIGVIMGGISSEREISLMTGREIVDNLNKQKYEVQPIIIDKTEELIEKVKGVDFVFIALHGKFGEDGEVQAVLQSLNIPYSGCGILCSSICMDKDMTKRILSYSRIKTGRWEIVNNAQNLNKTFINENVYPIVVKPNSGGSSVATILAKNEEEVKEGVLEALKYDNEVMLEEYIKGEEITCCILNGEVLPLIDIKPTGEFFDYTSKYVDGGAKEVVVRLEDELQKQVEKMALDSYKALKCSVYARVDMIIKDDVPYVLEANTLPGMTKNSLFPKSAKAYGISFEELLDKIVNYSLKVKRTNII